MKQRITGRSCPGLTLRISIDKIWYISFMHFIVTMAMRWVITGSRKGCRLRLFRQLAEQEGLTLLLQMLGDLASTGQSISTKAADAWAFASANNQCELWHWPGRRASHTGRCERRY